MFIATLLSIKSQFIGFPSIWTLKYDESCYTMVKTRLAPWSSTWIGFSAWSAINSRGSNKIVLHSSALKSLMVVIPWFSSSLFIWWLIDPIVSFSCIVCSFLILLFLNFGLLFCLFFPAHQHFHYLWLLVDLVILPLFFRFLARICYSIWYSYFKP